MCCPATAGAGNIEDVASAAASVGRVQDPGLHELSRQALRFARQEVLRLRARRRAQVQGSNRFSVLALQRGYEIAYVFLVLEKVLLFPHFWCRFSMLYSFFYSFQNALTEKYLKLPVVRFQ